MQSLFFRKVKLLMTPNPYAEQAEFSRFSRRWDAEHLKGHGDKQDNSDREFYEKSEDKHSDEKKMITGLEVQIEKPLTKEERKELMPCHQ